GAHGARAGRPAAAAARRPGRRSGRVHLPGRHADPGADARLHPEDPRHRGGAHRRRPVDAPPAAVLHDRPLVADPHPHRMTVADLMGRFGEQHVTAFILVLARVGPLFVLAPMFSSKLVPTRVRGIVAVALAIGLSPVVSKGVTLPTGVMDVTWLVLKEMLVGGAFA